jgi:hypothetical protein
MNVSIRPALFLLAGAFASGVLAQTSSAASAPEPAPIAAQAATKPPVAADSAAKDRIANTFYFHPLGLAGTIGTVFTPLHLVSLQFDYERRLVAHLAGIGTLSYQFISAGVDGTNVSIHYYDVMAGLRWYALEDFEGFYLQPMLDGDFAGARGSNPRKVGTVDQNRVGGMLYTGTNRRWGALSLDWNVGIGYLPWNDSYDEYKRSTGVTTVQKITEVNSLSKSYAGFLAGTPQFGMNIAMGFGI